jgi:hypothetical protein
MRIRIAPLLGIMALALGLYGCAGAYYGENYGYSGSGYGYGYSGPGYGYDYYGPGYDYYPYGLGFGFYGDFDHGDRHEFRGREHRGFERGEHSHFGGDGSETFRGNPGGEGREGGFRGGHGERGRP